MGTNEHIRTAETDHAEGHAPAARPHRRRTPHEALFPGSWLETGFDYAFGTEDPTGDYAVNALRSIADELELLHYALQSGRDPRIVLEIEKHISRLIGRARVAAEWADKLQDLGAAEAQP